MGAQVKVIMGRLLDDDDNIDKWESDSFTASDHRILLAHWYCKAANKAFEGEAKRKYFEHAGALLTADGTDDNLIRLEGTPNNYQVVVPQYNY